MFIDFYKAFDMVSHSFMFKTVQTFGFGAFFPTSYNGCSSSVKLANGMTARFGIDRGIQQGSLHIYFY